MSAVVCGKRIFDELHGSPPIAKRLRCSSNSQRFGASRSSSPGLSGPSSPASSSNPDLLLQLRALYPDMDGQLVEKVLDSCGNNLDSAIRSLNDLRLSNERNTCSSSESPATGATATAAAAAAIEQPATQASPSGMEWVELFVREMLSATDLPDARGRATRALEAFEKAVASRSNGMIEAVQKENESLKAQMQELSKANYILKRAVYIQQQRHMEHEERAKEVQELKQVVSQYQEQVRVLEMHNYALTVHLRKAEENSAIPGRFHPDIF